MTARIVPRPKADDFHLTIPPLETKPAAPELQTLAYATREKLEVNYIYVLPEAGEKGVLIAERPDAVRALAFRDGDLFDACDGDYVNRMLRTRSGEIIDGNTDWMFATTAVLGGRPVEASIYDIHYADTGEPIRRFNNWINEIAVLRGRLIYASAMDIRYADNDELIKHRPDCIYCPRFLNGRLIDASGREIRYTETDELIISSDKNITAVCPIPISLAERLMYEKGGSR